MDNKMLLEVKKLKKCFDVGDHRTLTAVDDVSFFVRKGETLGFVGESGCGKSTTGKTVMHLIPATSGQIIYDGEDITNMSRKEYLAFTRKAPDDISGSLRLSGFQNDCGRYNRRGNGDT